MRMSLALAARVQVEAAFGRYTWSEPALRSATSSFARLSHAADI